MARGYDLPGFTTATGSDEVFRGLILAPIIEPTSKLDRLRVLTEAGMTPPSYRTVTRRLRVYAGADTTHDRLEPQITVGLLTDGAGFPLTVHAFEGNRAETTTMLPVLNCDSGTSAPASPTGTSSSNPVPPAPPTSGATTPAPPQTPYPPTSKSPSTPCTARTK